MYFPAFGSIIRLKKQTSRRENGRCLPALAGLILFCLFAYLVLLDVPPVYAQSVINHTAPTVDSGCKQTFYSPDGNPFPLCPAPYPAGGNCVWWAWEQWHLLGYNLPLNWGNAADWVVDAEQSGLPIGTTPRVGAIAVFPRADGVWAFSASGHVAFVTYVSPDGSTFNVTYQNYGDPHPMYIGTGYNVSIINEPHYQAGELRFIYFPRAIDSNLFAHLPGIDSNGLAELPLANSQAASSSNTTVPGTNSNNTGSSTSTLTANQLALGLPPSDDQEFNADFTGTGLSDLLLYNRQQGRLDILQLSNDAPPAPIHASRFVNGELQGDIRPSNVPHMVALHDSITPVNGWGSNLDIHVGDFTGSGQSDILLYDRVTGTLQIISLTPQLTIKQHVILPGWGPDWEIYIGRFDGQRSDIFMFNRDLNVPVPVVPTPSSSPTPTPGTSSRPTVGSSPSPSPSPTVKSSPTAAKTPTGTPKVTPTVKPSPTPKTTPSPTATPTCTATATPTSTPTATPTSTPTVAPTGTPKVTPTPTCTATPTVTPTTKATPTPSPTPKVTPSKTTTPSPTPTPKATPTSSPTSNPTATATPDPTSTATSTPGKTPTPSPTPTATVTPDPTPTAGGTPTSASSPTPTVTPDPTPSVTASPNTSATPEKTPTPKATASPTPTVTPTPTASPTPKATPDPTATPTVTASPNASATPGKTPTQSPTPTPTPSPTATPTCAATVTPTSTPTVTPTATPTPTCTVTPTVSPTPTTTTTTSSTTSPTATQTNSTVSSTQTKTVQGDGMISLAYTQTDVNPPLDADLSSSLPGMSTQGLTPNVMVISLDKHFNVARQQDYTLMDNAWEVYVGRFVSANQDALFLYDRILGEARMVSFNAHLQVTHYQQVHNLSGNWEIYSGDFNGSSHAQVLMYDPGSGDAKFLLFKKSDLSLSGEKSYNGWQTNQVLYVGHFGLPTLSVMLFDPQAGSVSFLAFDKSLKIVHRYSVQNWNNHWQILVGAFVDRSRCISAKDCSTGDDILVLDRKTGQIQQYLFSFGRQFQVFDNRVQPFVREGLAPVTKSHLDMVDTTSFSLIATLSTPIHGEELY